MSVLKMYVNRVHDSDSDGHDDSERLGTSPDALFFLLVAGSDNIVKCPSLLGIPPIQKGRE